MVYISSLHETLGLPLHDILNARMCYWCVHNETVGPGVEDNDHRTLTLVQPQHLPLSQLPPPLLTPPRTPSLSPTYDLEVNSDL